MTRCAIASVAFLLLPPLLSLPEARGQEAEPSAEDAELSRKAFEEGNLLLEEKKYAEALARFREGLDLVPTARGLLYNGGLSAYLAGEFDLAIEWWKRLSELEPDDLDLRSKLIQAFQAGGNLPARDAARETFLELRETTDDPRWRRRPSYCREQMVVHGRRVYVLEHFELVGDRAILYKFLVMNADESKEEFNISLGSYESTTRIARQTGRIGPDQRLFHLDGYFSGGRDHRTYGFFESPPSYDDIRTKVLGILEGEISPLSSTMTPETKKDDR